VSSQVSLATLRPTVSRLLSLIPLPSSAAVSWPAAQRHEIYENSRLHLANVNLTRALALAAFAARSLSAMGYARRVCGLVVKSKQYIPATSPVTLLELDSASMAAGLPRSRTVFERAKYTVFRK
jgi:hypothetical protein